MEPKCALTVFIARHGALANPVHILKPYFFILILYFYLQICLPGGLFPWEFQIKFSHLISQCILHVPLISLSLIRAL
jgi:hypothetical protein